MAKQPNAQEPQSVDLAYLQTLVNQPAPVGHVDIAGRRFHFLQLSELERATLIEQWQYDADGDIDPERRSLLRARYAQVTLCTPDGQRLVEILTDEIPSAITGLRSLMMPLTDAILAFNRTPSIEETEKN